MPELGNEYLNDYSVPSSHNAGRSKPTKQKKQKNPLFSDPISPLSLDLSARVPSELHDYIIGQARNDLLTLSACSLVCRSWHASSTCHMFQTAATIHVHRNNFLRFCELLATQRLNAYIGRLNLKSDIIDETHDGGPTFQFNEHLQCFVGLQTVKYLRLEYYHAPPLPAFFTALAQNFSSVTALELSSMHFVSFGQIVNVHAALPLLRRLALVAVLFYEEDNDTNLSSNLSTTSSGLVDVVVDCVPIASALLWLPSHSSIRRLAIGRLRSPADAALVSALLHALGPALEHLIIYDASTTELPELAPATSLRTLEITGIQCAPYRNSDELVLLRAQLAWLPALLSQLNSRALQRIVLVVELPFRDGLNVLDWPRLVTLEGVERLEFSLSYHKKWAAKFIDEQLRARRYVLHVGQWERRYQYELGVFDP
ncbi:hypothetical protein DFH09DRAFT_1189667 [Mycena vulgaris]|nr:hypothetical protein DFH09DRAFT_1189667 [Mycena vulgaris]